MLTATIDKITTASTEHRKLRKEYNALHRELNTYRSDCKSSRKIESRILTLEIRMATIERDTFRTLFR